MNKKTVTLDYDEYQKLLNNQKDESVNIRIAYSHSERWSFDVRLYKEEEASKVFEGHVNTLKAECEAKLDEQKEKLNHYVYVSARLTKLENRNWFERLFNIDM